MKMSDWEARFTEDLASVASIADSSLQQAIDRFARVWQPMLRHRLLEFMSAVGTEFSESGEFAADVELRLAGDHVAFTVSSSSSHEAPAAGLRHDEPGDADARISLRLSESLKERITSAAATDGMSVNTWIARALDREMSRPRTTHQPAITARNQLRGYGRS